METGSLVLNGGVTAHVSGMVGTGGVAGLNTGSVSSNPYLAITVTAPTGSYFTGGWIGYNIGMLFNVTGNNLNVSGDNTVGGLVGQNTGSIYNSAVQFSTVGGTVIVGGLAGGNTGTIGGTLNTVYATNVTGTADVGGLVGANSGVLIDGAVQGGSTSGQTWVGGLVGVNGVNGAILYSSTAATKTVHSAWAV